MERVDKLVDWSECDLVEVVQGKVGGVPLLKNTRLPVEAIVDNYDAFRAEGLSPDAALTETRDCYPEITVKAVKTLLAYRDAHPFEAQKP